MLAKMGARELEVWRAWYAAEPRGEERGDMQAALIAWRTFLGAAIVKEGEPPIKVEHFAALLRKVWETPLTPKEKAAARRLEKARKRAKSRKDFRRMAEQMAAQERNGKS